MIGKQRSPKEPSIENNTSEYLLNVLGDVTGDVIMQGLTGSR